MIYLDNAATTKVSEEAIREMNKYFRYSYGNPSSNHEAGKIAKRALRKARQTIASTINAKEEEIFFTSGGTESDNLALNIALSHKKSNCSEIITSPIEHPAILKTLENYQKYGIKINYAEISDTGVVSVDSIKRLSTGNTILISIMYANNEIGTIQPIKRIGEIALNNNILFHTDAVQAYGQIPIDVKSENIGMLSASAHKFNGPKGVGFLYVSENIQKYPLIFGGGQEKGVRSGTENLPGIVGMMTAAENAYKNINQKIKYETYLRDTLIDNILSNIDDSFLIGERYLRTPGNVNICFKGINSSELIAMLDISGICVSGGAACSSNHSGVSHVLNAINLPKEYLHSAVRFTLSHNNSIDEINYTCRVLKYVIEQLRKNQ